MTSQEPNAAKDSFQRQIEPLLDRAAAYAYALVHNRDDAEDAVQDAALKGFLAFATYDPARPFKAWWFVIIRNCCRDLVRRRRIRTRHAAVDASLVADDRKRAIDPQEEMISALAQLSATHREVLELRYYGDSSYREIAAALGIPEGTVMSRLYAARRALAAVHKKEAT